MDQKKSVSILGTCICRDVFGLQDKDGGYEIERFIQDISPISIGVNRPFTYYYRDLEKLISDSTDMTPFGKRNFLLDFCGKSMEYLKQVHSDFLVLDMGCCRFDCYKFSNDKLITKMHNDQKAQLNYIEKIFQNCKSDEKINIISDNDTLLKMMDEYLPIYFEKIKTLYNLNKIILLETKVTDFTLTVNGPLSLNPYSNLLKDWTIRINHANDLARKYLDGCHYIKFPNWVMADRNHKWGPSSLHYRNEYYNYAFSCINIITQNPEKERERLLLQEELDKVETLNNSLLYQGLHVTLNKLNEDHKVNQRLMKYCDYFREILMDSQKLNNALLFLKTNNFNSLGIYGLSQVGIFWIDFFEKNGFEIKFIVENGGSPLYQNRIIRLKRGGTTYPKVDLVIIADFLQGEYLKKSLTRYTDAPIIDVFDLIKQNDNI